MKIILFAGGHGGGRRAHQQSGPEGIIKINYDIKYENLGRKQKREINPSSLSFPISLSPASKRKKSKVVSYPFPFSPAFAVHSVPK